MSLILGILTGIGIAFVLKDLNPIYLYSTMILSCGLALIISIKNFKNVGKI